MSLAQSFQHYFSVDLATTSAQRDQAFRIRYRVYCEEFKYERADQFPDGREFDVHDDGALHALITHKSSGMPAGCVRLLPGSVEGKEIPLPFENSCIDSIDRERLRRLDLDRNSVCEISRLAVDGAFRRRSGEAVTRFGEIEALDCTQQERRTFSLIAVAGFLAATALTDLSGRRNVFAMMEPFLPRMLKRSGIFFEQVGEEVDHHGIRAPYFITTQSALHNMRSDLRELYDAIYGQVAPAFESQDTRRSKIQRSA